MKAKRATPDWDAIYRDYRPGILSNVEIGKAHNVSEGAIRKRAKLKGWQKDLTGAVRVRVQEKLVRDEVRTPGASDEEIVEEKSEQLAAVLKLHRRDVGTSQRLVALFQSQLEEAATIRNEIEEAIIEDTEGGGDGKPDIKRRNAMLKAVSLSTHAGVLRDLALAQKNLIALERQAFNIDEKASGGDPLSEILDEVARRAVSLVSEGE